MIIDCHVHIFPPMAGPKGTGPVRGGASSARSMMFHRSRGRRLDDNTPVPGRDWYQGQNLDDVNFRGGGYGQFLWTVDGVDYARHFFPPTLVKLESTPEQIIAQLDYAGVNKGVIQAGYGASNRFMSNVVTKYPERFWANAKVDEARIDQASQRRTLDRAVEELGLQSLWFTAGRLLDTREEGLEDMAFAPFWDRVRDLGIPMFWGLSWDRRTIDSFVGWKERYPEIPCLIANGIQLPEFMKNGDISLPPEVWKPLEAPNVICDLEIPILQGSFWEYPYVEGRPIIRQYYERLGPDRLAWGSDIPNVERNCTYRQSLDYLRLYCDFIPADAMDKLLGGNVQRMFTGS